MTVFEFVLGETGSSKDMKPMLSVCKVWKVRPLYDVSSSPGLIDTALAKELALPFFWRKLSFSSPMRIAHIAADTLLELDPVVHLARWTQSLSISTTAPDCEYLNYLCYILALTKNLRALSMAGSEVAPLHLTALTVVQRVAAHSLRSLNVTLENASPVHMTQLSSFGNLRELRLMFWEPSEGIHHPKFPDLTAASPWEFVHLTLMDWGMEEVMPAHIDAYLDFLGRCTFQSLSTFALRISEPHPAHVAPKSQGLRRFFEQHSSIVHSTLDVPNLQRTARTLLPFFTTPRLHLICLAQRLPALISSRVVELEFYANPYRPDPLWVFLDEVVDKVLSRSRALRLLLPVSFNCPRDALSTLQEFADFVHKLKGYVRRLEEPGIHIEDRQGVRLAG
jgi:hypothetical protein